MNNGKDLQYFVIIPLAIDTESFGKPLLAQS